MFFIFLSCRGEGWVGVGRRGAGGFYRPEQIEHGSVSSRMQSLSHPGFLLQPPRQYAAHELPSPEDLWHSHIVVGTFQSKVHGILEPLQL